MRENFKQVLFSITIAIVASTVLLAKDINAVTSEPLPIARVEMIQLTDKQVQLLKVERAHYKYALNTLKDAHNAKLDAILVMDQKESI